MPRPTPKNPVVTPTQVRSRQTFEIILEATTYLIEEIGVRRITTNKIAERAGVNINSLYRYFLDKDAVFLTMAERHIEDNEKAFAASMQRMQHEKKGVRYSLVIEEMLQLFMTRPAFRREILFNMPLIVGPTRQQEIRKGLAAGLAPTIPDNFFPSFQSKVIASELIVHTFMTGVVVALSPKLDADQREAFRVELRNLLLRYVGAEWADASGNQSYQV